MEWNYEVDMVCVGAGAPGLAHAIGVDDLGGRVFVADSGHTAERSWLGVDVDDACTTDFFGQVTADLGPLRRPGGDFTVPVRAISSNVRADTGCALAPFVGSRLREWAAECLAGPFGFLSTHLPELPARTVEASDGQLLEVFEIGSLTVDGDDTAGTVLDWLTATAAARGIEVHPDHALQRLVFEEDAAVGAVFTTPAGSVAVRSRHGVKVASAAARLAGNIGRSVPEGVHRVCLVGQRASRFGRLELLTSDRLSVPKSATCHAHGRRLHTNLRESYRHSGSWRCGKLHGYPPLGE